MTVEELHNVLTQRLDDLEESRGDRHDELMGRLNSINGRVGRAESDIVSLRIRDAWWAGGVVAVLAVLRALFK